MTSEINQEYYINVAELMKNMLPRPQQRKGVWDQEGFIPIITVECEI